MYEQTYTHTHSKKEKRPLDILHAFINTFDKPLRKPILKKFQILELTPSYCGPGLNSTGQVTLPDKHSAKALSLNDRNTQSYEGLYRISQLRILSRS